MNNARRTGTPGVEVPVWMLSVAAFAQTDPDAGVERAPGCVPVLSQEEYRALMPPPPEPEDEPRLTAAPAFSSWRVEATFGRPSLARTLSLVPGVRWGATGPTHLDRPMRVILDGAALTSPLL